MVKEGFPFVITPLIIALIFGFFPLWPAVGIFVLLAAFMAYFFRDPHRAVPGRDDIIVSAADGRVTRIDENENGKTVSVFLSPLDVHINRAPIAGKVIKIDYIKGKKAPATSNEASFSNERNSLTIENDKITVVCTQIAGIVDLVADQTISGKIAKDLLQIIISDDKTGDPAAIVEARGMKQVTDTGAIEKVVDEIIAANPDQVAKVLAKPTLIGWFVGQAMKASGGKANPQALNEILKKKLGLE